jgi:hypothetical protein
MLSRALPAAAVADGVLAARTVPLTSRLTLAIAVKFPIPRLPSAH